MPKIKIGNPYDPKDKNTITGNQKPEDAPVAKVNPLEGMIQQKPKAKSYGFYLSDEVVEALDNLARQNKISKSKVLEMLLRKALFDE